MKTSRLRNAISLHAQGRATSSMGASIASSGSSRCSYTPFVFITGGTYSRSHQFGSDLRGDTTSSSGKNSAA